MKNVQNNTAALELDSSETDLKNSGKQKILVVDDEQNTRTLIAYHLRKSGYMVYQAENGVDALGVLQDIGKMDLMIVDVSMPKMNGFELCKKIREEISTRFIPFMFLSAKYQIDDKVKGLNYGADDYLTKPFHPAELLMRVKNLLKRNDISEDGPFPCPKCHTKGKIKQRSQVLNIDSINFNTVSQYSYKECDLCHGVGYTKDEHKTLITYKKQEKHKRCKRFLDIIVSIFGLFFTALIFPFLAILIKLDSKGPVLFQQIRIGKDRRKYNDNKFKGKDKRKQDNFGIPFTMYKFRTMTADAETKSGPVWAKENDPRITWIGNFMRKTRLDELPQFYNILKGDMSFVGPRPERVFFGKKLAEEIEDYKKRFKTKPGLTGIAQILDGYDTTIEKAKEKVKHDIGYNTHKNFWLDLHLIFKTVKVIFTHEGAH